MGGNVVTITKLRKVGPYSANRGLFGWEAYVKETGDWWPVPCSSKQKETEVRAYLKQKVGKK